MIRQDIYLERYDWHVRIYYAATTYWVERIVWLGLGGGSPQPVCWPSGYGSHVFELPAAGDGDGYRPHQQPGGVLQLFGT